LCDSNCLEGFCATTQCNTNTNAIKKSYDPNSKYNNHYYRHYNPHPVVNNQIPISNHMTGFVSKNNLENELYKNQGNFHTKKSILLY
jgi:hypothetical protein